MNTLSATDLEVVYDVLAEALDQATPAKAELFLTKLALLGAQAIGDAQTFTELTRSALQDL
ncbi:DUF2783 domain-containing protein [Pseudomonas sp. CM25]|uniref:DUF2783 domain-containing protein n=1 Tax=unclassified Pseudomonas TaxID=196821 RepID=UPI001556C716|nr:MULTISPECIES: DUF2783 domain-containing protein [unclassified Pseudomonas]NQD54158.1 DUF2783 domain-containing protein [Pseudomonas sp. CM25]NQD78233.1 DUF2783 domain-containing protein [Pseudomonas sp. CM27]